MAARKKRPPTRGWALRKFIEENGGPQPQFLREWREARGIILEDMADAIGLNIGYLSRVERNDKAQYNKRIVEAYAVVCGVRPGDVISSNPAEMDPLFATWEAIRVADRAQALRTLQAFRRKK